MSARLGLFPVIAHTSEFGSMQHLPQAMLSKSSERQKHLPQAMLNTETDFWPTVCTSGWQIVLGSHLQCISAKDRLSK